MRECYNLRNCKLKQYIRVLFLILLPAAYLFMILDYAPLLLFQLVVCYTIFKKRYFNYEHIVYSN